MNRILESEMSKTKPKNFGDTYLYNKGVYEKEIFDYLMRAERLDKNGQFFEDLKADIKKQRTSSELITVLESPKTILCIGERALPRAFKSFVAKDIKENGENRLFIDVTGLIVKENGAYVYNSRDLQIIISYLLAGMVSMIYYADPDILVNKHDIIEYGCKCFSSLVFYIIDYLRIVSDATARPKIKYLASKYFQLCIMNKKYTESVENWAIRVSQISDQDIIMLNIILEKIPNPYENIKTFIDTLSTVLKNDKLTVDVFVDKWMYNIGTGTQFGVELFPSFANILIYAYVGAYLNNQKTIEKAVGRDMVSFVTGIMNVGRGVL